MPTLDWMGKKAVLNHHREVPYRLLRCDNSLSVGDPDAGNASTQLSTSLLVQGDNFAFVDVSKMIYLRAAEGRNMSNARGF